LIAKKKLLSEKKTIIALKTKSSIQAFCDSDFSEDKEKNNNLEKTTQQNKKTIQR